MKLQTIAALVAASLALSACTDEEIDHYTALLKGDAPPVEDYVDAQPVIAALVAAAEEETLRMIAPEGSGPMGEEIWSGPGCAPLLRVRVCE